MTDAIIRPQLVHYSDREITGFPRIAKWLQRMKQATDLIKPIGLWVTPYRAEDNWFNWSLDEKFQVENLQYEHFIFLKPNARILWITSVDELDKFREMFKMSIYPGDDRQSTIDWPKVTKAWDGIMIVPYVWERRLEIGFLWYYGWDCASGCIWRGRAIDRIELGAVRTARMLARLYVKRRERWDAELGNVMKTMPSLGLPAPEIQPEAYDK